MPHITVEATPVLGEALPFADLFADIHRRIADAGHAALADLKSRAILVDRHLAGDDPAGEFVVARLVTTNPRPEPEQQVMARIVHDVLRSAIERLAPAYWWQCCVFNEPFRCQDYLKTDSRAA